MVLGVSDVDRSKAFYEGLGWRLDADFPIDEHFRIVQFTPPGSPASIQFGTGVTSMEPGSVKDIYLAVGDIEAARDELIAKGADVSEVWHGRGLGSEGHAPGRDHEKSSQPHNWWDWYAAYLSARLAGSSQEEASAGAGRYMAETKHVLPL